MRRPKNVLVDEFVKSSLSDEDNLIYEKAMDELVEQVSCGFSEYCSENYWVYNKYNDTWYNRWDDRTSKSKQLYKQFIETR